MTEVEVGKDLVSILMGPGGVIFIFVTLVVAVQRKWLVPGWIYESCLQDGIVCRTDLAARVSATEAEVQQYRKERGGTHAP